MTKRAVITGAFSYTGATVAREMLNRGWTVHTLTNRSRPPEVTNISSSPLKFDIEYLKQELKVADVFINTYWVRLPWKNTNFQTAIENTHLLIKAVAEAKIPRLVHVSVSNAEKGQNLGYYRGKFELEKAVKGCGISYAIVCPTLIVGPNDILTNNIVWFLRHFPFFPLPQGGHYSLRPVTLTDTARIIADTAESKDNMKVDAAGPDTLSFRDYLIWLSKSCGVGPLLLNTPNWFSLVGLKLIEPFLKDVILTREELRGLQQELLCSNQPSLGKESALEWLRLNAGSLGKTYSNDIQRHFESGSTKLIFSPNQ